MVTLDSILNWTIPPLAVLFFVWVFYKSLQGPLGGLGAGIRSIFQAIFRRREEPEWGGGNYPLVYE